MLIVVILVVILLSTNPIYYYISSSAIGSESGSSSSITTKPEFSLQSNPAYNTTLNYRIAQVAGPIPFVRATGFIDS
ncbi:hypothetical protein PR003_g1573 [Phytophthora rubi]|uniref:Uncharacterized protein n=1 Tax=Phytophthora rubi TaxID=129364 RepID=A0A6A3J4R2_9STRA|nr:hypothetical protein PR001_g21725 [Phytophthora rubi]KAE9013994.1 hypothetical protein PR002_g14353 [Phytophthora rubi]KAE9357903.1 hypothetical protein PR003_g1573 [Phytophthora rubi]